MGSIRAARVSECQGSPECGLVCRKGLGTVALGLLAFQLAGNQEGAVLGTALAIKMVAYVGVAPVASAFTHLLPRRTLLVSLDVVRVVIALLLPFVTQVWQVYLLIFVCVGVG